jgi:hypothetical protein
MILSKDRLSRLGRGKWMPSQISSFGQIWPAVGKVLFVQNNWIQS